MIEPDGGGIWPNNPWHHLAAAFIVILVAGGILMALLAAIP